MQRAAGEEETARMNGTIIADAVAVGARRFLQAQRMLVVASGDSQGRPWASVLFGTPGFTSADDAGRQVIIDRTMTFPTATDAFWAHGSEGASLGLLAIDLQTRRRLRINGVVEVATDAQLLLRVEQAYPNCPKYIQRRHLRHLALRDVPASRPATEGLAPSAELLTAAGDADTAFVASGHPSRGLDASHRGGSPGFIEVCGPDLLRVPDYAGNGMFNTLGNLTVDPRCGLTLIDFRQGRLHQMTGEAEVHVSPTAVHGDSSESGRFWDFRVGSWRSTDLPVGAEWDFLDYSLYNPALR